MERNFSNRIRSLYKALVMTSSTTEEKYETMLIEGLRTFNLSFGIISHIQGKEYKIVASHPAGENLLPGTVYALENTYCEKVVSEKKIISTKNAGKDRYLRKHPVYTRMKLESYISAPVWVRGDIWGTVNFSSLDIRKPSFKKQDYYFIALIADGISALVEREVLNKEKENVIRELTKTNSILEKVFDNASVGMALVSTEGQWLRVNMSLVRMLGYSKEYLLNVTFQDITHPEMLH